MLSVSVLMPVFNGEKYLGAAVESILAQTYPDFELVILDDGSTDGSLRMLRQFRRGDPRIRIISREHRGFDDTANQLIGLARGEYVALMAQDDIALPERLALQVAFLRSNPEVLCVGGSFEVIDGDGRFLTILRQPETDQDIQRQVNEARREAEDSRREARQARQAGRKFEDQQGPPFPNGPDEAGIPPHGRNAQGHRQFTQRNPDGSSTTTIVRPGGPTIRYTLNPDGSMRGRPQVTPRP